MDTKQISDSEDESETTTDSFDSTQYFEIPVINVEQIDMYGINFRSYNYPGKFWYTEERHQSNP